MCEKDETRENGKNEYVEREREREIWDEMRNRVDLVYYLVQEK
jgi:hypothetical protein